MNEKQIAGEKAVEFIKEKMTIGLGSGSTAVFMVRKLGEMVKQGLNVKCVSTSNETTSLALSLGIPLVSIDEIDEIDLTIDGADEVDPHFNGIKGGGGALLFEKIIAAASKKIIWVVDSSKMVNKLGKYPLPLEVLPFGYKQTLKRLKQLKYNPVIRSKNNKMFVTDGNNYIIDLHLEKIDNPVSMEKELNMIPGVVENGLFINKADIVIVGKNGNAEVLRKEKKA
jgi:ribose 5-phosphate isomerase A